MRPGMYVCECALPPEWAERKVETVVEAAEQQRGTGPADADMQISSHLCNTGRHAAVRARPLCWESFAPASAPVRG
jgi:hypothetical protein